LREAYSASGQGFAADYDSHRRPPKAGQQPAVTPGSAGGTNLNSVPITYTSQEQVEVYRFSAPAADSDSAGGALLQAFLPLRAAFLLNL